MSGSLFWGDRLTDSDSTSTTLLEGLRVQDQAAWDRLVRVYGPLVVHWCRTAGLDEADRADVFQEVFQAVYRSLHQFEKQSQVGAFRGWLRTITRNKIIDHVRRIDPATHGTGGSEMMQLFASVTTEEVSREDDATEFSLVLTEALASLESAFEPKTWRAFWRGIVEGQATHLVAQELGMTEAAVRKAKSRVLQKLRQELDGLESLESPDEGD